MYRLAQLGQRMGGNKAELLARLHACEAGGDPPAGAHAAAQHAPAAQAVAGPADKKDGAGTSGLMPKGGSENFVRINLKVGGGAGA